MDLMSDPETAALILKEGLVIPGIVLTTITTPFTRSTIFALVEELISSREVTRPVTGICRWDWSPRNVAAVTV